MNISGLSDRSTEEWKERGVEEEGVGKAERDEEEVQSGIRVIKFGFCMDFIKAPQISIRLPHSWPSLLIPSVVASTAFHLPVFPCVILQAYD